MKLTCDYGGELRGQCPQLRRALRTITRLEMKLCEMRRYKAKPAGRVLARGCACRAGNTWCICLLERGMSAPVPGCTGREGGKAIEVREVKKGGGE